MQFATQVAVISGGAGGLGRAYAIALAQRGGRLVLLDCLDPFDEDVIQLVATLERMGSQCLYRQLDICDRHAIDLMVGDIIQLMGQIDILIHASSFRCDAALANISEQNWAKQLEVDVTAAFHLTRAVWPYMQQRNYGRVLMQTSAGGLYGDIYQVANSTAKMALVGMVNSLSIEGGADNIAVNSLCPLAQEGADICHLAAQVQPMFSAESVVAAMMFLVGRQAPTGQHLLAAAGSISHGTFLEYQPMYFPAEECTVEHLVSRWAQMHECYPVYSHESGEDQILSWARRAASDHHIRIE